MIVPLTAGSPEERRDLADGDGDGEADDEAGHHRRRQELRQEAEARGARHDQDRARR